MVTVVVVVPLAVTLVGDAEMVEFATVGGPAVKVTLEVSDPRPDGVAILTVLVCMTVDLTVPVATPDALVVEAGWTSVTLVPVAANVVEVPLTGFPLASFRVIVTVEVATPSAATKLGEAAIVEVATFGAPATKVTVVVTPVRPAGAETLRVFISATVDFMDPVVTPDALVVEAGWVSVFPVPVEVNVTLDPLIALPFTSLSVIVTTDVAVPSAVTLPGEAAIVEVLALTGPGTNVTVEVTAPNPAGVAILRVFTSEAVEAIVPVVIPDALVVEVGWSSVFPVPVAVKAAVLPLTGLLFASFRVMVTVEVAAPSAVTVVGDAEIDEFPARAGPATKVTEEVTVFNPAGPEMLTVLDSATVDAMVPVVCPEAFVTAAG